MRTRPNAIGAQPYSPGDDQRLLDLRSQGRTDREIADMTGRSIGSVGGRFHRLRRDGGEVASLRRQPWSEDRVQHVIRLLDDGMNLAGIARIIGANSETVRRYVELLRAEGRIEDSDEDEPIVVPPGDPLLRALRAEFGRLAS